MSDTSGRQGKGKERPGSVWLRESRKGRSHPPLNREQIVRGAVRLLDEGGVRNLRMRQLAESLNAAPMTLYWHVPNKDDLLELAVDAVFPEPATGGGGSWQEDIKACAVDLFEVLLVHSWVIELMGGHPPVGPRALAHTSALIEILESAEFAPKQLDSALSAIYYYTLGAALSESSWQAMSSRVAENEKEWLERLGPYLDQAAEDHPKSLSEYISRSATSSTRTRFLEGLECMVTGLEEMRAA